MKTDSNPTVTIPYELLRNPDADVSELLRRGYGNSGLGVLTISGVPGFLELRRALLSMGSHLASLTPEELANLEDPASSYNIGWSCGKEALVNGRLDTYKGSFYANPTLEDAGQGDVHLAQQYPEYFRPNVWPGSELPGFKEAFQALSRCIHDVGLLLAQHCDKYVQSQRPTAATIPSQYQALATSRNHKARFLHYFPRADVLASTLSSTSSVACDDVGQDTDQAKSSTNDTASLVSLTSADHDQAWCSWHTDHSSLTGLTRAMYVDGRGREVQCPDPGEGLYVRNRAGRVIKITIPDDHVAFQVGESLQIQSGGLLQATPHYVRAAEGPGSEGIARTTLAVFMQPDVECPLEPPPGVSEEAVAVGQWRWGQTFGAFAQATIQHYYKGVNLMHQGSDLVTPTHTPQQQQQQMARA